MEKKDILSLEERINIGIDAGESHFREFKSASERDASGIQKPRDVKAICRDIGETLVAFANADGGELIVGVEDDGCISGIAHKNELVDFMKEAPLNYIHKETPIPKPIIADLEIDSFRVLYFSVNQSIDNTHITSDGRCLRRFDRENKPVSLERIQADRTETISREYDRKFVDGATIADLNVELISSISEEIAQGFSVEKALQYLGLADYTNNELKIRRAALLLFAKDIVKWHPRSAVRLVQVKGNELGVGEHYNVAQDEQIIGTILEIIEDSWTALRPFLARTRYQKSGLFRESLVFPEVACREALVNAIAHRDYSREGNAVEVFIFEDRMEFKSPGGLLSKIKVEQLQNLEGVHESRNVLISKTLREIGYMREMGEGIPRIFRAMRDSELVDPLINSSFSQFKITLKQKSIFTSQDIEWLEGYREFDLTKNEQRVVLLGRDGHLLSTNEIIDVAGIVDIDDFRYLYEMLRKKGIMFSEKPRPKVKTKRRDVGRFKVNPPRVVEKNFGELLQALQKIAPTDILSLKDIAIIKENLSENSPYYNNPYLALLSLGFVDAQKNFLPKALNFVPELGVLTDHDLRKLGKIVAIKPARYGFIRTESGQDYFFHISGMRNSEDWYKLTLDHNVSFIVRPGITPEHGELAADILME